MVKGGAQSPSEPFLVVIVVLGVMGAALWFGSFLIPVGKPKLARPVTSRGGATVTEVARGEKGVAGPFRFDERLIALGEWVPVSVVKQGEAYAVKGEFEIVNIHADAEVCHAPTGDDPEKAVDAFLQLACLPGVAIWVPRTASVLTWGGSLDGWRPPREFAVSAMVRLRRLRVMSQSLAKLVYESSASGSLHKDKERLLDLSLQWLRADAAIDTHGHLYGLRTSRPVQSQNPFGGIYFLVYADDMAYRRLWQRWAKDAPGQGEGESYGPDARRTDWSEELTTATALLDDPFVSLRFRYAYVSCHRVGFCHVPGPGPEPSALEAALANAFPVFWGGDAAKWAFCHAVDFEQCLHALSAGSGGSPTFLAGGSLSRADWCC